MFKFSKPSGDHVDIDDILFILIASAMAILA